ncbi:MAG: beta-mannosidase [Clostridiales bacterium]|nr:beta-mannosidase [Clostridiales bacterium]
MSLLLVGGVSCNPSHDNSSEFVTVNDGQFFLRGKPYKYIGANMWYGSILASEGEGGDTMRLAAELDSLKAIGVDNLRILVGGEGVEGRQDCIAPLLQQAPGIYNDTLLRGLDNMLVQLEKRDMRAVLYLGNSWEWSGGFGVYLEWAGRGESPLPNRDSYNMYTDYVSEFTTDTAAMRMYADNVAAIVGRVNSLNGVPYSESPAIMSWQIANEPRCFDDSKKEPFEHWISDVAQLIKRIDPNHLVSTGSEGSYGCEVDIDMWARIHNSSDIDYATIHIWPYNWRWTTADSLGGSGLQNSIAETLTYINDHRALTSKPIVIEEFGYPRDSMSIIPGSATDARDVYYNMMFSQLVDSSKVEGVNFWAWGGDVIPLHSTWEPGDAYTGDPAQEPQGLYSVFAADTTTIEIIKNANNRIKK